MDTENGPNKVTLTCINPDAPRVAAPEYPGEYYDALVPATLDLAERARLCVNALTETTDPDYDDELYWIVDLLAREPAMYHTVDEAAGICSRWRNGPTTTPPARASRWSVSSPNGSTTRAAPTAKGRSRRRSAKWPT